MQARKLTEEESENAIIKTLRYVYGLKAFSSYFNSESETNPLSSANDSSSNNVMLPAHNRQASRVAKPTAVTAATTQRELPAVTSDVPVAGSMRCEVIACEKSALSSKCATSRCHRSVCLTHGPAHKKHSNLKFKKFDSNIFSGTYAAPTALSATESAPRVSVTSSDRLRSGSETASSSLPQPGENASLTRSGRPMKRKRY